MWLSYKEYIKAYVFILVYLLRVFSPLLIFTYPVFAVIFNVFLDIIDGDTSSNFLTKKQYQHMDKLLDFWWLTVVMIWSFPNLIAYKWPLLALYLYRFIGVLVFEYTGNRKTIFFFPNFFENLFFLVFFANYYPGFNNLFQNNKFTFILLAFLIKIGHEYWLHVMEKSILEDIFKIKRKWNESGSALTKSL